jgi:hypothetical protein
MKHTVWEKNDFSHVNIIGAAFIHKLSFCLFVTHHFISHQIYFSFYSCYIDIGMAHHIILDHSQLKLPEVAPQDAQINYACHNSVQGKEPFFIELGSSKCFVSRLFV